MTVQDPARCRSCGASVLWVLMVDRDNRPAKRMPLDPVPTIQGSIRRRRGEITSDWYGKVVMLAERVEGEKLYTPHFATCPQARKWRR